MQPSHAIGDLHFAVERLGLERIDNAYAWRNLIDQGLIIAGGTDAPVEIGDPRIEFYAAVTEKMLMDIMLMAGILIKDSLGLRL